jgi:hypothetical protein
MRGNLSFVAIRTKRWGFEDLYRRLFLMENERVNKLHFPSHTLEFASNFLFLIDHPHNVHPYTVYIPFLRPPRYSDYCIFPPKSKVAYVITTEVCSVQSFFRNSVSYIFLFLYLGRKAHIFKAKKITFHYIKMLKVSPTQTRCHKES